MTVLYDESSFFIIKQSIVMLSTLAEYHYTECKKCETQHNSTLCMLLVLTVLYAEYSINIIKQRIIMLSVFC
jgi:hypothetical protein